MSAMSTFMAATRPAASFVAPADGPPDSDVTRHASQVLSVVDGGTTTLPSITETTGLSVAATVAALGWLSSAHLVVLSQAGDVLTAELTDSARTALSSS